MFGPGEQEATEKTESAAEVTGDDGTTRPQDHETTGQRDDGTTRPQDDGSTGTRVAAWSRWRLAANLWLIFTVLSCFSRQPSAVLASTNGGMFKMLEERPAEGVGV